MSVHVTTAPETGYPTVTQCRVTLKNKTIIDAKQCAKWLMIDGAMAKLDEYYEPAIGGPEIDPKEILSVSYFGGGAGCEPISWWRFEGVLYYFQGGCYYNSETKIEYTGPTENFDIVVTTVVSNVVNNNTIGECWAFSAAYEYNNNESFQPCTKATRMVDGRVINKYFRGVVELDASGIFEDEIPASVYDWEIFEVPTGEVFDLRNYPKVISGISLNIAQRPAHFDRSTGLKIPASSVKLCWFEQGRQVREYIAKTSTVPNLNTHGGQETFEKNYTIAPIGGAVVTVAIRVLKYPIVDRTPPDPISLEPEIKAMADAIQFDDAAPAVNSTWTT
jgi:hypothetical protein